MDSQVVTWPYFEKNQERFQQEASKPITGLSAAYAGVLKPTWMIDRLSTRTYRAYYGFLWWLIGDTSWTY